MKMDNELSIYEAPMMEVIEVVVECGFEATTGGTGDDMGWG